MDDFRKEMDRMFEGAFSPEYEGPMYDVQKRELHPLVQITETEDDVLVVVDLPCVEREDIKLNATENAVRIEAKMRECVRLDPWGPVQHQAEFEVFRKTIRLSSLVNPEQAKARFKDGILEVRFPKKVSGSEITIG